MSSSRTVRIRQGTIRTKRSGTRRSVPRLVRLKWVERAVPQDNASICLILHMQPKIRLCLSTSTPPIEHYCIQRYLYLDSFFQCSSFDFYVLKSINLMSWGSVGLDWVTCFGFSSVGSCSMCVTLAFQMNWRSEVPAGERGTLASMYGQQQRRQREIASLEQRTFVRLHVRREEINCITRLSDTNCLWELRMDKNAFAVLCDLPQTRGGLVDDGHVTIEEQVATFANILAHHNKNRPMQIISPPHDVLLTILEEMVADGVRCEICSFKAGTFVMVATKMREMISGMNIESKHIQNKLKRLKEKYSSAYDMMNTSGFGWDDEKKCVVVDSDDVLQLWVKKHPNASCKLNKPFPLYPRLCMTESLVATDAIENIGLENEDCNETSEMPPTSPTPSPSVGTSSASQPIKKRKRNKNDADANIVAVIRNVKVLLSEKRKPGYLLSFRPWVSYD
ncbi:hypothetical protein DVH24_005675 [Malus domestica]|uniref:Uncharacterized protein n=1 Tax=Malus domestica TaxID=3750 RepID=A0A498IN81_MALDO|nr:hypothetical protein DVH24_005675 [Malus domestica]